MDATAQALTDMAMGIEEADMLPRSRRREQLRKLQTAAQARDLAEFTTVPADQAGITDQHWQQTERTLSMLLGCSDDEY